MEQQKVPEPIGWVSAIFPGPQQFSDRPPRNAANLERSRVCEIVWLDAELFHQADPAVLVATAEDEYPLMTKETGVRPPAGILGEQLSLRDMDFLAVEAGQTLRIGDAVLKVLASDGKILKLELMEEGLVEPGSPVVVI